MMLYPYYFFTMGLVNGCLRAFVKEVFKPFNFIGIYEILILK